LNPLEGYYKGPEYPKLPENFDNLNINKKNITLFKKDQAASAKAYKVATYLNNYNIYTAK